MILYFGRRPVAKKDASEPEDKPSDAVQRARERVLREVAYLHEHHRARTGKKPAQRKVLPRQIYPKALEREYARNLSAIIRKARGAYAELLKELPALVASVARERERVDSLSTNSVNGKNSFSRADFDPDQPRDERGRFGEGGGGSLAGHTGPFTASGHWRPEQNTPAHKAARDLLQQSSDLESAIQMFEGEHVPDELPTDHGDIPSKEIKEALESYRPKPIPKDADLVTVHHSTTKENAERILREGAIPQAKPTNLAREQFLAGEDATFAPGRGISGGLYVAGANESEGFGRVTLELKVPKSYLKVPPESAAVGEKDPEKALHTPDGAVILEAIPASAIRRVEGKLDAGEGRRAAQLLAQAEQELARAIDQAEVERLARQFAANTATYQRVQLSKQVKAALGADVFIGDRKLADSVDGFVQYNVSLIKRIPVALHAKVESIVQRAVTSGTMTADLTDEIEKQFGISERHSKLIARDQSSKFYSQVAEQRQRELGITRFIWRTANDERVRGDPDGLYPDAKSSHYDLDGKTFAWNDLPMDDKGERISPGSPIQCRCFAEGLYQDLLGTDEDTNEE